MANTRFVFNVVGAVSLCVCAIAALVLAANKKAHTDLVARHSAEEARAAHRASADVLVEPLRAHYAGSDDYTWDFVARVTHRGTGTRALLMLYSGRPVVINLPAVAPIVATNTVEAVEAE